jgi:hypothetical protein
MVLKANHSLASKGRSYNVPARYCFATGKTPTVTLRNLAAHRRSSRGAVAFHHPSLQRPQTESPKGYTGAYGPDAPNKAFGGPVPEVYPGAGRDEVGPDGISTKVVKAAPCSTTARETDGTTTCIGIPGPVRGGGNSPQDTTTGMAPPR